MSPSRRDARSIFLRLLFVCVHLFVSPFFTCIVLVSIAPSNSVVNDNCGQQYSPPSTKSDDSSKEFSHLKRRMEINNMRVGEEEKETKQIPSPFDTLKRYLFLLDDFKIKRNVGDYTAWRQKRECIRSILSFEKERIKTLCAVEYNTSSNSSKDNETQSSNDSTNDTTINKKLFNLKELEKIRIFSLFFFQREITAMKDIFLMTHKAKPKYDKNYQSWYHFRWLLEQLYFNEDSILNPYTGEGNDERQKTLFSHLEEEINWFDTYLTNTSVNDEQNFSCLQTKEESKGILNKKDKSIEPPKSLKTYINLKNIHAWQLKLWLMSKYVSLYNHAKPSPHIADPKNNRSSYEKDRIALFILKQLQKNEESLRFIDYCNNSIWSFRLNLVNILLQRIDPDASEDTFNNSKALLNLKKEKEINESLNLLWTQELSMIKEFLFYYNDNEAIWNYLYSLYILLLDKSCDDSNVDPSSPSSFQVVDTYFQDIKRICLTHQYTPYSCMNSKLSFRRASTNSSINEHANNLLINIYFHHLKWAKTKEQEKEGSKNETTDIDQFKDQTFLYKEYQEFFHGLVNSLEIQLQNERQVIQEEVEEENEEEKEGEEGGRQVRDKQTNLDPLSNMKRLENKRKIQQTKLYLDFVRWKNTTL